MLLVVKWFHSKVLAESRSEPRGSGSSQYNMLKFLSSPLLALNLSANFLYILGIQKVDSQNYFGVIFTSIQVFLAYLDFSGQQTNLFFWDFWLPAVCNSRTTFAF